MISADDDGPLILSEAPAQSDDSMDRLVWASVMSEELAEHNPCSIEVITSGQLSALSHEDFQQFVRALPYWHVALKSLMTRQELGRRLGLLPTKQWVWDITLLTNAEIQALNREHRQQDKATDVLSFPAWDLATLPPKGLPEVSLGSIVVSVDYGLTFTPTTPLLVYLLDRMTHGTLHLLGFHHDTMAEFEQVVAWQGEVLAEVESSLDGALGLVSQPEGKGGE
jgi:rRNA maturation RNase YbeY